MNKIVNQEFLGFKVSGEESVSLIRAVIACDTAEDIPEYNGIEGYELDIGSVAWDISNGEIYALNSSHEWVKQ